MFYVFSGGQEDCYIYQEQYRDAFPNVNFGNLLRLEYMPTADHIFTDLGHQKFLVAEMAGWLARFSAPAGTAGAPAARPAAAAQQAAAPAAVAR
jgi:hypothetical protein